MVGGAVLCGVGLCKGGHGGGELLCDGCGKDGVAEDQAYRPVGDGVVVAHGGGLGPGAYRFQVSGSKVQPRRQAEFGSVEAVGEQVAHGYGFQAAGCVHDDADVGKVVEEYLAAASTGWDDAA